MPQASDPDRTLRVLIVDDDRELGGLMQEFLARQGLAVTVVHDGQAGLREAASGAFDVVTLDVMMPGLNGFQVLSQLRRRSAVPVIMLTARTATDDRISGLEAGADDYLLKPFHPGELLARIRAVLRRAAISTAPTPDVLEVGDVRLHVGQRHVWCRGQLLALTTAEFDILEVLLRRAGLVVSRDDLAAVLYQRPATPNERSVDLHMSHVRRKLQTAGADPIRTVRGVGYLFAQS